MPEQAKQLLLSHPEFWREDGSAAWQIDWPKPPRSVAPESSDEVIEVTWTPEVVFSLDRPRRRPPPLPSRRRSQPPPPAALGSQQTPSSSRDSDLFSLDNLTKLTKSQLGAEERAAQAAQLRQPPELPWSRRPPELAVVELEPEEAALHGDSEELGALVRRSTRELPAIRGEADEVILAGGSWQSNLTATPRAGRSWHLEGALLALGGTLAAVLGTLAALL